MPRKNWNGRRVTNAVAWVIARDHGMCWLCGHGGANSLDHVLVVRDYPELEWTRTNWKAAHRTKAGSLLGCQVNGCTCPGNLGRGASAHTAPSSRPW